MGTFADEFVRIRPDLTGFSQELKTKAEMGAGDTGKGVGKKVGVGVLAGLGAAFAAGKIVDFFKDAFAEAQEAAKVTALTNAVLKSTGGVANVTAKDITGLADSMSNLTGVDDETIQSAENVMLTFTKVRNEAGKSNDVFNQGVVAAENLSAALGTDLQSATILVGKALNDPIGGLTALKKAGIQFTDAQKDQIKTMVQAGDTMGAQKMILAELTTEFGGAAAAARTPAEQALVAWKNFEEEVGNKLLPIFNEIVTFGLKNQAWLLPLIGSVTELVVISRVATVTQNAWTAAQSVFGVGLDANVGKIKRTAAAIGGLLVVTQLASAAIGRDATQNVDDLTTGLAKLGKTGDASGQMFKDLDYDLGTLGSGGLTKAGNAISAVVEKTGLGSVFDQSLEHAQQRIAGYDQALAQMAQSGHTDQAAAAFQQFWLAAQKAGISLDDLRAAFPQYIASVGPAAKATTALGAAADKAADSGQDLLDTWNELNGVMIDADHAALEADKAIAELGDTFKGTARSIDINTTAGLTNRVALEDAAQAAAKATAAYIENGGTAAGAAAKMAAYEAAAIKSTGATGKNKDAVKALADQLFLLPSSKTVTVNVAVAGVNAMIALVEKAFSMVKNIGKADGGIVDFYAQGGENHVAQIVTAATTRVWAEPETGGEAYIPLGQGKRARSTAVLSDVAKRFGYGLVSVGGSGDGSLVSVAGPAPAAGALATRAPLTIEHYHAAESHSEYRLAQELDWLARGGG